MRTIPGTVCTVLLAVAGSSELGAQVNSDTAGWFPFVMRGTDVALDSPEMDMPRTFRYGKIVDMFYEPYIQLQSASGQAEGRTQRYNRPVLGWR